MQPKHQKIKTTEVMNDGSSKITTRSYYEELSHILEEVEKPSLSTDKTLESDIMNMLRLITNKNSPKLSITITSRSDGNYKVVSKHVTIKRKI